MISGGNGPLPFASIWRRVVLVDINCTVALFWIWLSEISEYGVKDGSYSFHKMIFQPGIVWVWKQNGSALVNNLSAFWWRSWSAGGEGLLHFQTSREKKNVLKNHMHFSFFSAFLRLTTLIHFQQKLLFMQICCKIKSCYIRQNNSAECFGDGSVNDLFYLSVSFFLVRFERIRKISTHLNTWKCSEDSYFNLMQRKMPVHTFVVG